MMMQEIRILGKLIVAVAIVLQPSFMYATSAERISSVSKRLEMKADRIFIKGDHERAMRIYEQANRKILGNGIQKSELNLKMGRLYTLLQQAQEAVKCFDVVYNQFDTMLTVNDVCFFLDALRQNADGQRAEIVARNYAFKSPYSRNQRYMNTLYALSNQHHYYNKGDSDYAVTLLEKNTSLPEYWVGKWDGKPFYAVSHSSLQDPLKIFYHRTQYFSLTNENLLPFKSIPRELQSGPVAFSNDQRLMVATGISYRNTGRIIKPGQNRSMYTTQLYYSRINPVSGGWQRFFPLFDYQEGASYAHPAFFNNGKSLIFSSDRLGGHGGMDLYRTDWDELQHQWSDPVNLGSVVNTEGDEIYPQVVGETLYFSSNGHEGYGGYDIYRVGFNGQVGVSGTLFHYSYPINTSHNDFGVYIDGSTGYFISDRRGASGKDDIYTFDHASTALGRDDFIGVSKEHSAMSGKLNTIEGFNASYAGLDEKAVVLTRAYRALQEGEMLLSIYFEFNQDYLDSESISNLRELIQQPGFKQVSELSVIGYADEFGTPLYNQRLSDRRATAVANFLINERVSAKLFAEGRGQLYLSWDEYQLEGAKNILPVPAKEEVGFQKNTVSLQNRIRMNRKARRVDIIVKKK